MIFYLMGFILFYFYCDVGEEKYPNKFYIKSFMSLFWPILIFIDLCSWGYWTLLTILVWIKIKKP